MTEGRDVTEMAAINAYRTAFRKPSARHAIFEDYRAAMDEDLKQDAAGFTAGRKINSPMLVLWPDAEGKSGRPNPADIWRRWATDVSSTSTCGGHLQPEDALAQVLAASKPFLARNEI